MIRKFYIRKIKTCAQFFVEKLKAIVTLFPKLDVGLATATVLKSLVPSPGSPDAASSFIGEWWGVLRRAFIPFTETC